MSRWRDRIAGSAQSQAAGREARLFGLRDELGSRVHRLSREISALSSARTAEAKAV